MLDEEGTITVREQDAAQGDWYELRVADDGPGIPDGERTIRDEDAAVTPLQHGSGSGIGLWTVVWVVSSVGGSVTLDTGDEGTVVTVTLHGAAA
jgi:signal transduction histidine kinase